MGSDMYVMSLFFFAKTVYTVVRIRIDDCLSVRLFGYTLPTDQWNSVITCLICRESMHCSKITQF